MHILVSIICFHSFCFKLFHFQHYFQSLFSKNIEEVAFMNLEQIQFYYFLSCFEFMQVNFQFIYWFNMQRFLLFINQLKVNLLLNRFTYCSDALKLLLHGFSQRLVHLGQFLLFLLCRLSFGQFVQSVFQPPFQTHSPVYHSTLSYVFSVFYVF